MAIDANDSAALWRQRMDVYLCRDALYRADEAFGRLADANHEYDEVCTALEAEYGRAYQSVLEAKARQSEAFASLMVVQSRHDQAYLSPMWEAERELVLTPAPDLAAALFKVDLIEREEVWNDTRMTRDCFEIVAEDFARLLPEAR